MRMPSQMRLLGGATAHARSILRNTSTGVPTPVGEAVGIEAAEYLGGVAEYLELVPGAGVGGDVADL
jgi:hypothetical protein